MPESFSSFTLPIGSTLYPLVSYQPNFQAAVLPQQSRKRPRQVFVAYAYGLYPKADYRKVFTSVKKAFQTDFVFADEKITDLHILEKIRTYIAESQFGIYDITGWNANVTLELGLAFGMAETAYIAFDPTKTALDDVPADLRGFDRMEYTSYTELETKVGELIAQELPLPTTHEAENQLTILRSRTLEILEGSDGLTMGDIAKALGISTDLSQVVVRPLVGGPVRTKGQRKGTKYFLSDGYSPPATGL